MPLERALLPPFGGLADWDDDRVAADASRAPRWRAAVRVVDHLRARVARIARGAFERDDLRRLAQPAAELIVDFLEARPVLAGDLHGVARHVDVRRWRGFRKRPGFTLPHQELDGLERLDLGFAVVVDVEIVE